MQLLEQEKKKAYAAELQAQMQAQQAQKQQERQQRFGAPTGMQQQLMGCETAACGLHLCQEVKGSLVPHTCSQQ